MSDRLIIFTRYPEPGKSKTRLISALGAEGAAKLQQQMTEHTITIARQLLGDSSISIAVYFAGGNKNLIQDWLGNDLLYCPQLEKDLGSRMQAAFADAFNEGFQRVVTIGIDCPQLDKVLLLEAFESLEKNDLVLGPATDGGYYLIGLQQIIPQLFIGINWGTSEVLAMTQNIVNELHLNCYYLPILSDIDRPEDLPLWQLRCQ